MSNKLLFCQCYNEMSTKNVVFNNPEKFLTVLNKTYPFAKKWIKPKIFESETPWPQEYF